MLWYQECPQFVIVYPGCCRRVMTYWSGDYLIPGVSATMLFWPQIWRISGELRDKVQVVELAR